MRDISKRAGRTARRRAGLAGQYACALAGGLLATGLLAGAGQAQEPAAEPIVGGAIAFERSGPVTSLERTVSQNAVAAPERLNPLAGEADAGRRGTWGRAAAPLDPLAQTSVNAAARTPKRDFRFKGNSNPDACGGCAPPDTNGEVGTNHFVQMVNATKVAIFDKTGKSLTPPFNLGTLWSSGPCTSNRGDPIVVYDDFADRWVLTQFQNASFLCFAVSETPDPLGSYFLYTFDVGAFPDYFKVGVWQSGYYVSANEASYTAYAFDRSKMLAGDGTASFIKFTGETNLLLPSDADVSAGSVNGGYFYTYKDDSFHGGSDRIELFQMVPDFPNTTGTFTLIETIPVAPFTYTVCGFFNFNCAAQKGTSQKVDTVSEWPMFRFVYKKIGNQKSLLGNFTVGGGQGEAGAAIRWFELRKGGAGNWNLYQEGTFDPGDGHDRFMGSIAMDKDGNIALGYTVASSSIYPKIRYTTRKAGDPLGTMGNEKTLKSGKGSQTGTNRWGDYTEMSVDPVGGCQFWYTNEDYKKSSASNWRTTVGTFTIGSCTK